MESEEFEMTVFIQQARIYDVLLALLKEANPDVARDILELHSKGMIVGTTPAFNGVFLTDEMNNEPTPETDK